MRRVNQIVDYTGFFRDKSEDFKYTDVQNFEAEAWFGVSPTTPAR